MPALKRLTTAAAVTAALLATLPAWAQTPPAAALVPAQSEIGFTSRQMGVPVDGHFKRFDAQIALDPRHPDSGSVAITIDLASVSIGTAEVEEELAKPEWFDTLKAATARFQSSAIKPAGGGRFDVTGKLTLKGGSHDLVVPVSVTQNGGTSVAAGQFTLKRLSYGIGSGDWSDTSMVADEVIVKFKLALTGLPAL